MHRVYNRKNNNLIYYDNSPTNDFWDNQWSISEKIVSQIIKTNDTFVTRVTKNWLNKDDGIILEGGCGRGHHVAALKNNGYNVIGLDFAINTVKILNEFAPQLDIQYGDVRKLPFEKNNFSGYWSLGVIEHFIDGYSEISKEMYRVIKPNGKLFLTFPYMSPIRTLKAKLGMYSLTQNNRMEFYQYALDYKQVNKHFNELGFHLIKKQPFAGLKGLKDEAKLFQKLINNLIEYRGRNIIIRLIRKFIGVISDKFTGHCILLIFEKVR